MECYIILRTKILIKKHGNLNKKIIFHSQSNVKNAANNLKKYFRKLN